MNERTVLKGDTDMNNDKRARYWMGRIEKHYESHKVAIELPAYEIIGDGERFIFDVKLKRGTKERPVFDRASDIQTALELPLLQPFKEGLSIRLAVSEHPVRENSLQKILESRIFQDRTKKIPLAVGYDLRGDMHVEDLSEMPHLLIAGASNSGKSVALRSLITSIIAIQSVDRVNLLLFDIGAYDLEPFSEIPHLSYPIVKDSQTGIGVMLALKAEMERRIDLDRAEMRTLPSIVCVVDEYVSFISSIGDKDDSKLLTETISSLLRRGRHARIHMVLATQDPTIKSTKVDMVNITSRMAFACAKPIDSVTILGRGGAEKLPGKGAMLFKSPAHIEPVYFQGSFISREGVRRFVERAKIRYANTGSKKFVVKVPDFKHELSEATVKRSAVENKEMAEIIVWALGRVTISALQIQKQFHMGNRAVGIIDELCEMKLIGNKFAHLPRTVLPQSVEDIPDDAFRILLISGVPKDDITRAFQTRGQDDTCETMAIKLTPDSDGGCSADTNSSTR